MSSEKQITGGVPAPSHPTQIRPEAPQARGEAAAASGIRRRAGGTDAMGKAER